MRATPGYSMHKGLLWP